jgi:hypothetical protein
MTLVRGAAAEALQRGNEQIEMDVREKGTGPFCAQHPPGRSGK